MVSLIEKKKGKKECSQSVVRTEMHSCTQAETRQKFAWVYVQRESIKKRKRASERARERERERERERDSWFYKAYIMHNIPFYPCLTFGER